MIRTIQEWEPRPGMNPPYEIVTKTEYDKIPQFEPSESYNQEKDISRTVDKQRDIFDDLGEE